ncbi:hypothetical protein GCM10011316_14850 [Roseibium aquae]|uniref:Methyl-accepting chemotaxis sensory transducer with Pas/Pac sensor n=1 Tax=Roseibium aquae TaxID=1323746 RepID=A0A916TH75_9HYPH|nr:methyl-accepting chemotaxis protein [Roseibium aquae]GGB43909.1 hypothetical protein GCM10011316_14850 [Roseibium aquae]
MVRMTNIKAQLAVGFGSLMGLVLVLALLGVWGAIAGTGLFSDYRTAARESVLLGDMQEDVLSARLRVMKYRALRQEGALEDVRAEMEALIEEAGQVKQLLGAEQAGQIVEITRQAGSYSDAFSRALDLYAQGEGINADLDSLGTQMRQNLTDIMASAYQDGDPAAAFYAGRVQEHLMLARYYGSRFVAQNDAAARARVEAELKATSAELQVLQDKLQDPGRAGLASDTQTHLDEYIKAFANGVETQEALTAILTGELDVIGPQMLSSIGTLVDHALDTQSAVGPEIMSAFERQVWLLIVAGGLALAVGVAAALLIGRSIIMPVETVAGALERLGRGDTGQDLEGRGRTDAIGRLILAYGTLRETVRKAFTQAQMIDQMPLPVMVADPDNNFAISYMNPTMERMADSMAGHLNVPVDQLIGTSIDTFHKNPQHQRQILSDPSKLPYSARISFAGRRFSLKVSAIMDASGAYAGPMVVWDDITEREQLAELVNSSVTRVAEAVGRAKSNSGQLASVAEDTQQKSASVSAAAEQASTNVKSVAAATEELSASISEISQQVVQSSGKAREAAEIATGTQAKAGQLNENSMRIGDILKMISDIAEQTNLLALNATIEAARAGEAGKGFAVVASEVKNLASQTANATIEIGQQIEAMQSVTQATVDEIGALTHNIAQISEMLSAVAAAAEEQGAATHEISRNVTEAAQGTQEVSRTIIAVRDGSEATDRSAQDIQLVTDDLQAISGELGEAARRFLENIRAA